MTLQDQGDRVEVSAGMTLARARALLEEGATIAAARDAVFDLSGVTEADSSGVAVLLGWQRAARAGGRSLRVVNAPASLRSLAALYGVDAFLPLA